MSHVTETLRVMAAAGAILIAGTASLGAQIFPLSQNNWSNPEFQQRFLGSYGVNPGLEPTITTEEQKLFQTLMPLLQSGDLAQAIATLKAAMTPESSGALDYNLGNFHFQQGDFSNASQAYKAAIKKFPTFLRAYENLARAQVQLGEYKDARPMLVKAIELGGSQSDTYGLLGYCYLNEGNYPNSLSAYRIASILAPENRDWKVGIAQSLLLSQQYDEAVPVLNQLIHDNPKTENFYVSLANAYLGKDQPEQAARVLELLKRLGLAKPSSLQLLGDIYVNADIPALAYEAYTAGISTGGSFPAERALRIASVFIARGNFDEATSFIGEIEQAYAQRLTPAQKLELLNMRAKVAMSTGDRDEAARLLTEVTKADPLNGEALLNLGSYYWDGKDYEQAEFYFERALKVDSVEARACIQYARMRVELGELEQAAKLLRRAVELQPSESLDRYLAAVEDAAKGRK